MIPWIHMYILPDSRVISCCASNFDQELGYLNKKSLKGKERRVEFENGNKQ